MPITLETPSGKKLSRSSTTERVDLLSYYSKTFSIVTERLDQRRFSITVFKESDKSIAQQVILTNDLDSVEEEFELLKTKYIFNYSNL